MGNGKKIDKAKKKIKKKYIIIISIVVSFFALIIIKIILPFYIMPREIIELNNNMNINLPFKFGDLMEESDLPGDEWERSLGMYNVVYNNHKGEYINFEGFPDLANEYKLTSYSTTNEEASVFGIHVGDKYMEADKIFRKYGYRCNEDEYYPVYYKGRIEININRIDDDIVGEIFIDLKSTDWKRKGYYK